MRKPNSQEEQEIKRLILEKLVMGKNWNQQHVAERNVPKGLPTNYNMRWYHYVKHKLAREGLLRRFKEGGDDLFGLNVSSKPEIMKFIGTKIRPQEPNPQ